MNLLATVLALLAAYLVGSLSFAVLVSRVLGLADPRSYGSRNPGATNVLRSGNRAAAVVTLALDALKGYVPVLVCLLYGPRFGLGETAAAFVGLAAFLGHLWPVLFRVQGGQGGATAAGGGVTTPAPLPAVARRPLQPQIPVAPVQVDFARLQADLTALMADYGPRSSLWFEDLSSGRRLSLGADERFHPASTLKLPLVVALFEGAQQGRWTLDDRWAVNDDDWEDGAGDLQDVAAGSEFTLRELARRAIVDSDNIAANALLRKVGFEGVRISMRQAGAALTSGTLTSLSTADLGAVLSQLARRSAANPRAWQPLLDWLSHSQRNDWLPAPLPSSYTVFHKWGAYGGAENDAGIVSGPEARYVLVVFTDGTSDGGDLIRALSARVARAFPLPQVH